MKETMNLEPVSQIVLKEKNNQIENNYLSKIKTLIFESIGNIRHFIDYLMTRERVAEYNLDELAKNIIPRKLSELRVNDLNIDDNDLFIDYKEEISTILANENNLLVKDLASKLGFLTSSLPLIKEIKEKQIHGDYVIIQNLPENILEKDSRSQNKMEASFSIIKTENIKNIKLISDYLICYNNEKRENHITSSNDKHIFVLYKLNQNKE